jgi:hypothetical protein
MKRRVLVCLVAACVAGLAPQAYGAGVGLKLGFSLSKLAQTSAIPPALQWDNLPFFAGGLSFESRWGYISLQPELLFVRMGGKYIMDADNSLENQFNYIQVPILVKFNANPKGSVDPFICGGGYGSYLIKAQGLLEAAGETTKADLTDDYERFDYGIVAGAGLTFRFSGLAISLEGRYCHGLGNVYKDPAEGDVLKNRSLMAFITVVY